MPLAHTIAIERRRIERLLPMHHVEVERDRPSIAELSYVLFRILAERFVGQHGGMRTDAPCPQKELERMAIRFDEEIRFPLGAHQVILDPRGERLARTAKEEHRPTLTNRIIVRENLQCAVRVVSVADSFFVHKEFSRRHLSVEESVVWLAVPALTVLYRLELHNCIRMILDATQEHRGAGSARADDDSTFGGGVHGLLGNVNCS